MNKHHRDSLEWPDAVQSEDEFRAEIRDLVRQLPSEITERIAAGTHLLKSDYVAWQKILYRRGWGAYSWPVEFGGTGWSARQRYVFEDEIVAADAPPLLPFNHYMIGPVLCAFGTPEQQQRYLPSISSGDAWWCQGYSERGAGSDLASLKTTAKRDGEWFVLNGHKIWTTQAHFADFMFALVRTRQEGPRQAGISLIIVDMKSPGLTLRPVYTLDNGHAENEIFFDDVRVPVANLIGQENEGWNYSKYLVGLERGFIGNVPNARRLLRRFSSLARSSHSKTPTLSLKLAELHVDLHSLSLTSERVLAIPADTLGKSVLPNMFKIMGSNLSNRISFGMVEHLGKSAQIIDPAQTDGALNSEELLPASQRGVLVQYMHQIPSTIYGGTNEIQHEIIAKHLFSQPRFDIIRSQLSSDDLQYSDTLDRFIGSEKASFKSRQSSQEAKLRVQRSWSLIDDLGLTAIQVDEKLGGLRTEDDSVSITALALEAVGQSMSPINFADAAILAPIIARELDTEDGREYSARIARGLTKAVVHFADIDSSANGEHVDIVANCDGADSIMWVEEGGVYQIPFSDVACQRVNMLDNRVGVVLSNSRRPPAATMLGTINASQLARWRHLKSVSGCIEAAAIMNDLVFETIQYLNIRQQFSVALASFQVLRHRIVDMWIQAQLARFASWRALEYLLDGEGGFQSTFAAQAARVVTYRGAQAVGREAIQMHGGMGVTDELIISHRFKRLLQINAGGQSLDRTLSEIGSILDSANR